MDPEIRITTERIDDFPLLLETLMRLGLAEIIDRHLTRHGLHQGLSGGWIATIWLAHILSQGDHRKLPVQAWVKKSQKTLEGLTGQKVRDMDFTDDKLTILLRRLSKTDSWQAIETDLGRNILRVYKLAPKRVRLDPTTVSGHHAGGEDSLFQYGHSKDDATLKQVKVMMAALDPLGLPLVTEVVAGDKADDPLYIPAVDQVLQVIAGVGLLFVGDSKMSALAIRAHIQHLGQYYLCPLAQTGNPADEMPKWVQAANDGKRTLHPIYVENDKGETKKIAEGYEFNRTISAEVDSPPHPRLIGERSGGDGKVQEWTERVFVVRSETYQRILEKGLEGRLQRATAKLLALTPAPGRGKRQIRDESALLTAAEAILKDHDVEGLLTYAFERQEKHQIKYIGRGRGGPDRPTQEIVTVRYQITAVVRQEDAIVTLQQTFGWRAYVTNAPAEQLTLEQVVLTYRDQWIVERGFHRLKGAPLSLTPLFVQRDDQVVGLTNLLSIAVRILTLIEFVVRRKLKDKQEKLVGLLPQNPKKGIDNPTTERLLKVFNDITLTIVHLPDKTIRHLTPLTHLQTQILTLLNLHPTLYTRLAEN